MSLRRIPLFLAMAGLLASLWAAEDPFWGTWKLDPAKSSASSGPPPELSVMKIEPHGEGITVTRDLAEPKGKAGHWEFTANFDGKDYPVTNDPTRETVAFQRIDSHTLQAINRKDGKVNSSPRWVVSQDGKTLTIKWQGRDPQGQPTNNVRVYDKQ